MSDSKKKTGRKYINPGPYNATPKFGKIELQSENLTAGESDEAKAALDLQAVNPLGVITLWKTVCNTCHVYCSSQWRTTQAQADNDALPHIQLNHWTGYVNRYVRQVV